MAQKFTVPITIKQLSSAGSDGITIFLDGDEFSRLQVQAGGRLVWGDGAGAGDTNLYRDAANVLKTDDTLKVPVLFVDDIEIDTTGASNGLILMFDGTKFVPTSMPGGEPMGFVNRTHSTISFDEPSRVFTIQPVSGSFEVWCKGKRYVKSSAATLTIPDTSSLYYIYYDTVGTLSYKTSFFDFENDTPVAYIYWNATDDKQYFFADERHGVVLDWQTHEYLHRTRGAAYASGFGITNYTTTGTGASNADMQFDLADGTFFDEDMQIDIVHDATPTPNTWEQILQGAAEIPVFYKFGTSWKHTTPTEYPVKQGTLPQYNLNTAGSWSTPDIATTQFGITWVCATNNLNYPVIGIMGQDSYPNLNKVAEVDYVDLDLSGLPIFELRPLYKISYLVNSTFTNTPKAAIREVIDIRRIMDVAGGVAATPVSDHGSLLGLTDDDHTQYVHTDTARTITAVHTFSNGLSSNGQILVTSPSASTIPIIVNGAASQTANLQEWRDSSGTVLTQVSSTGQVRGPSFASHLVGKAVLNTDYDTNSLGVAIPSIESKGLVIRAAFGQLANIEEWQNSSGNALSYVTGAGIITSRYAIDFDPVVAPTSFTLTLLNVAGNVNVGTHYYYVTYTTADGETELGPSNGVAVTTVAGSQQVQVNLPISTDYRVTGRKIYRSIATDFSGRWQNYLLATITDNTTTTFTDNVADATISTGVQAYARDNTTVKFFRNAGAQVVLTGVTNTFVGRNAGSTISGNTSLSGNNVGVGVNALRALTSGRQNTALGFNAGLNMTAGSDNIAVGFQSLGGVVTGNANVAVGRNTAGNLTSGSSNIFIGYYSGASGTITGSSNSALGNSSLLKLTSGSSNVAVGDNAGTELTTGQLNTLVGVRAGAALTTTSNNLMLGNSAGRYATASNELYVDVLDRTNNTNEKARALLYGIFNSSAASQTLAINAATTVAYGLNIFNAADVKSLIVRGFSAQTATLQEWQDSAGTVLGAVTSAGRLGLGSANPIGDIQVTKASGASSVVLDQGTNALALLAGSSAGIFQYSGNFGILNDTRSGITTNPGTSGTYHLWIQGSTGAVGIGTSSPAYKLDISGDARINSGSALRFFRSDGTTQALTINSGTSNSFITAAAGGIIMTGPLGIAMDFAGDFHVRSQDGSTSRFLVRGSDGNVGINDSSPSDRLVVNGRMRVNGTNRLTFGNSAGGFAGIGVTEASTGTLTFTTWDGAASVERMRIVNTGNIGIGSNAPGAQLQVNASSASTIGAIVQGAASQTANIFEVQNSAGSRLFAIESNGTARASSICEFNTFNNSRIQFLTTGTLVDANIASNIVLAVQARNASQTADIQQWQNSSGTALARITSSGKLVASSISGGTA